MLELSCSELLVLMFVRVCVCVCVYVWMCVCVYSGGVPGFGRTRSWW